MDRFDVVFKFYIAFVVVFVIIFTDFISYHNGKTKGYEQGKTYGYYTGISTILTIMIKCNPTTEIDIDDYLICTHDKIDEIL